jgi:hypothetical protein
MKRGTTPVLITSSIGGLRSTETHTEEICMSVNPKSKKKNEKGTINLAIIRSTSE